MRQALLLVAACAFAGGAAAEDVRLCGAEAIPASADGRLLNHFPYTLAARTDLVRPRGLPGQCQGLHRALLADLEALLARARADPEVGGRIIAMSCFRSRQYQNRIFCRRGRAIQVQAYQVAPPGFSEHATGLAIDFGDRFGGRCNLETCFANTPVGRWLARHASDFGFELSFPEGNAQGVAFEPWHWRWVGRGEDGRLAKEIFAAARDRFPAAGRAAPTPPGQPLPLSPASSAMPAGTQTPADQ